MKKIKLLCAAGLLGALAMTSCTDLTELKVGLVLESVYKAGAEKASYIANKTLRKVYKKVGFVAK